MTTLTLPSPKGRGVLKCAVTIVLSLVLPTLAGAADSAPKKVQSVEGITEFTLDNGMQVLLYPDPSKPTVTVNLTILVGSRHEGYGEAGMAHLLEHMLFKGTPTNPQIPKLLQEKGAHFNGTTWVDRTNYFETLPASDENLEFALKLESDRLINSYVRQEDLFSEMTVVRNEFEAGENSPSALLYNRMMAVAYDWHNYGKTTIGNRIDIERVPINRLKAFYTKYYQPDNALLVVAGKFDPEKALKLINETFGAIPRPTRKLDPTYTEEPPQDGERSVTLRRVGDVGLVCAMYHVPSGSHPDAAAFEVLGNVLASPPSGRLYKALVETHMATEVDASLIKTHDAGIFEVDATIKKGDSIEKVRDAMIALTENLGQEKFTAEEVDRAKQRILKQRELASADTGRIAVELSEWAALGDWRLYFMRRDRIEKVTPEDVRAVAEKYLKLANRTLGTFIPSEKSDKVPVPESPDLAELFKDYKGREQVADGEAFDVAPDAIEARTKRLTLPDGMKVVLLPKKTRGETVRAQVVVRYGTPANLHGYETAADYLPPLMMRGTKKLTRQQIQDELDKNKATMTASGDPGVAVFDIETKKANLPAVLDLLRQILREPTLPKDEFEVLQRQQQAGLEEQLADPTSLARTQLRRTVSPYDKNDVRYTPTVEEDIARNKALTLEQVKALYGDFLGGANGEIAIVGDFNVDETTKNLRDIFSGWSTKQPYARIPKQAFTDVKGSTKAIQTPDKANSIYLAGQVISLKDDDPDFAALVMGNFILGSGGLSSRLGDRVRQKEGLSYGVGSQFAAEALDPRASMTLYAITNPTNMSKVETAIKEEVERIIKDGVTASELDQARSGYLQQQEVSRTNDAQLAGKLADTAFEGRTMKYYSDLEKKMKALKPEDVQAALKKHIDPQRFSIVTAGDFKAAAAGAAPPSTKKSE